eukprot:5000503-Amphidinium_carterae.1
MMQNHPLPTWLTHLSFSGHASLRLDGCGLHLRVHSQHHGPRSPLQHAAACISSGARRSGTTMTSRSWKPTERCHGFCNVLRANVSIIMS